MLARPGGAMPTTGGRMSKARWLLVGAVVLAALAGALRLVTTAFAGPAYTVSAELGDYYLPADGHSTTTLTATVTLDGVPQPNVSVSFGVLNNGDVTLTPTSAVTNSRGQVTTTTTASTTLGSQTLTATAGSVVATRVLVLYGAPVTATLKLKPASITADGVSTTTAVVILTDSNGDRVPNQAVTLTTIGSASIGATQQAASGKRDGIYWATITASRRAQTETVTATTGTLSVSATLTETAGAPATVSVTLGAGSLVADGASTTSATATVDDTNGNPVPGATVGWSVSDPGARLGSASGATDGSGMASTTITASTKAQTATLTAAVGGVQGTASLKETNGPVARIALGLGSSSIAANGTSTASATATLTDANGNAVSDGSVDFSTNLSSASGGVILSPASQVPTTTDGVASTTVTSSTTAGPQTLTATAHSTTVSSSARLVLYGAASSITLQFSPTYVPVGAGGTATATALVVDAQGDPVPGQSVVFATTGDAGFCVHCDTTVITGADGSASIGVTGAGDPGPKPFTASTAGHTALASLVVYGAPSSITIALAPASVVADGTTAVTATATVSDGAAGGGDGVPGQTVRFTRNGVAVGGVTDRGDGTYTVQLTASRTAQVETVTATDPAITGNPTSASATFTETAGPGARVALSLPRPLDGDGRRQRAVGGHRHGDRQQWQSGDD